LGPNAEFGRPLVGTDRPLAFSFSNGRCSSSPLVDFDPSFSFWVTTDSTGTINQWQLTYIRGGGLGGAPYCEVLSINNLAIPTTPIFDRGVIGFDPDAFSGIEDSASNQGPSGTWSAITTPEPSSLILVVIGIAGLFVRIASSHRHLLPRCVVQRKN